MRSSALPPWKEWEEGLRCCRGLWQGLARDRKPETRELELFRRWVGRLSQLATQFRTTWDLGEAERRQEGKLLELGRSLATAHGREDLLERMLSGGRDLFQAERVAWVSGPGDPWVVEGGAPAARRSWPALLALLPRERKERLQILTPEARKRMAVAGRAVASSVLLPVSWGEDRRGWIYFDSSLVEHLFDGEPARLLPSFGSWIATLMAHWDRVEQEEEHARLRQELALAGRMQQVLLPSVPPEVPGLSLAGRLIPARETGGDLYDFVWDARQGRLTVAVGDVAGKGMGAALVMAMLRSLLRYLLEAGHPLSEVMTALNHRLHQDTDVLVFVSLEILQWESGPGRLTCCGAGHEPLLLYRERRRGVETLVPGGVVLGVRETTASAFPVQIVPWEPGDQVLLFSDGLTEAMNPREEQFERERLAALFARLAPRREGRELLDAILDEVSAFEQGKAADDKTLVWMRRQKPGKKG